MSDLIPSSVPTYTAFAAQTRIAGGSMADIAEALARLRPEPPLWVFDDGTGAPVDAPPLPEHAGRLPVAAASLAPPPSAGRPRLGVVAREVTLLPRHWDWLAAQPGGASAALRRLVEDARKVHAERDRQRAAKERSYRFMSAIAGHLPGFEEASRALFADSAAAFDSRVADWPADVRAYLRWLARDAFAPDGLAPDAMSTRAEPPCP